MFYVKRLGTADPWVILWSLFYVGVCFMILFGTLYTIDLIYFLDENFITINRSDWKVFLSGTLKLDISICKEYIYNRKGDTS